MNNLRIATFNLENLDDKPGQKPTLTERISAMNTTYDQYLSHIFEDIVKQYIIDLNIAGKLPFAFERIGRQWGKIPGKQKGVNTYEIDVVALNEGSKEIMFVECK